MPRYFQPVGGFTDGRLSHIRIDDDGNSFEVAPDGSERNAGTSTSDTRQWVPAWSLDEMANRIRDGKWEELAEEPKAPPQAIDPTADLPQTDTAREPEPDVRPQD